MRMKWLFILSMWGWSIASFSQVISGKVIDRNTREGVPFANVYLNSTSLGVATELNGEFSFKGPEHPGVYEVVVSFVGYETRKFTLDWVGTSRQIGIIELTPKGEELNSVEVVAKRDVAWERKYGKFKKAFLGNTDYARECEILNPWEIEFKSEKEGILLATANNPIQIQNNALGYLVFFDLTQFKTHGQSYLIEGHTRFLEQSPKDSIQRNRWKANREVIYRRSRQYLLRSIVQHRLHGEGFKLYREKTGFENQTSRSAFFYQELGRFLLPMDTGTMVRQTKQQGVYSIRATGNLEVHYTKAFARRRTYNDVPWLVGWVNIQDSLLVNEDGIELNPLAVNVSGYLNAERVANLLPLNYKSKQQESSGPDASAIGIEQIYVHTDKPYYYPGETIWLAGYLKRIATTNPDSLSKVVRLELLKQNGKVVQRRLLAIDSGLFNGSITIPDTTSSGAYFLRAYTHFNRNFGEASLYAKYIPLLPIKAKVRNPTSIIAPISASGPIRVNVDKKSYGLRDKVEISITLAGDSAELNTGHLSVSVTDAFQVAAIDLEPSIAEVFSRHAPQLAIANGVKFEREQGICFSGRYKNEKSKTTEESLDVLRLNPPNFANIKMDAAGNFKVRDGMFYDTVSYVIKSKSKSKGKIAVDTYQEPLFHYDRALPPIDTVAETTVQRLIQSPPSDSSLVLNTVVVKGRKVRAGLIENYKSTMGKPDYVLPGKDINKSYGNLLLGLQGKFPGLIIRYANLPDEQPSEWQVYTLRGISAANPRQVLVTINDVPMSPPPGRILSIINPDMVESVELTNRLNPLYGGSGDFTGGFGVLAIYTKTGSTDAVLDAGIRQSETVFKVMGLSKPQSFISPDYAHSPSTGNLPDARSTLYWDPNVQVTSSKPAEISFYTSDMPGGYRVVVEGVLSDGTAVRCISYVKVED